MAAADVKRLRHRGHSLDPLNYGGCNVIDTDIRASNGYVHTIDCVVVPGRGLLKAVLLRTAEAADTIGARALLIHSDALDSASPS